jgi:hypothetical protein
MTTHAIGYHCKRYTTTFWMWNQCNTVLLLLAVALMLSDAGIYSYRHFNDPLWRGKNSTFSEQLIQAAARDYARLCSRERHQKIHAQAPLQSSAFSVAIQHKLPDIFHPGNRASSPGVLIAPSWMTT